MNKPAQIIIDHYDNDNDDSQRANVNVAHVLTGSTLGRPAGRPLSREEAQQVCWFSRIGIVIYPIYSDAFYSGGDGGGAGGKG